MIAWVDHEANSIAEDYGMVNPRVSLACQNPAQYRGLSDVFRAWR